MAEPKGGAQRWCSKVVVNSGARRWCSKIELLKSIGPG